HLVVKSDAFFEPYYYRFVLLLIIIVKNMVDIMACNCIRKDKEGRYNVISYKKVRSTSDKSKQVNLISHVSKIFVSCHMT
ncbi:MAG: hypothetical protein N4R24_04240, partial [Lactobacillus iners]|nr:hypothetical protein [Lactobacillus iners]